MNMKFLKYSLTALLGASATAAMAGSGGTEFSALEDLLTEWAQGVLGRILAIGALIVGIAFGLVRQSVIAAVIGIAMAVVLFYGPTVITNIVAAAADGSTLDAVSQLTNGLF